MLVVSCLYVIRKLLIFHIIVTCIYAHRTRVHLRRKFRRSIRTPLLSKSIKYSLSFLTGYNMNSLIVLCPVIFVFTIVASIEIDTNYLKCLVCRSTIKEIEGELGKIDPSREIEIGNYRLDAEGNVVHKKVPLAQSEVHISDVLDNICEKMSDYVRATYKSNGELTILNLMGPSGGMNPEMTKVDIIQDDDINRSLKYYCEGIVEEFEDSIISLFVRKADNIKYQMCTNVAKLCNPTDFAHEADESDEDSLDEEHNEL
nr:protein seele isoform X1 [Megalopta genalis]XP_033321482.1 protein seele isoform X1 [Megalopta genalis]XP_033321483.1 protein seele isoform X1 [Megalopta genalis]